MNSYYKPIQTCNKNGKLTACLRFSWKEGLSKTVATFQDWETVSMSLGLQILHKTKILANSLVS